MRFKVELDNFLYYLLKMMWECERSFVSENKKGGIEDPGVTRNGKKPDIHLERSIRRQRLIRYIKWFRKEYIDKYHGLNKNNMKYEWLTRSDLNIFLAHVSGLVNDSVETYIYYLSELEFKREQRFSRHFIERLMVWEGRRTIPHIE